MKYFSLFFCLLLFALPFNAQAQRTRLAAALMEEQVLLTSNFNGTKITIFGAVEAFDDKIPDVVIVVRGPDRQAWVSKATKVAGLWIGHERLNFLAAPTFFGVASTRPLSQIAPEDTLRLYGISAISQLDVAPNNHANNNLEELKSAYINTRKTQKLYFEDGQGVRYFEDGLFRADIKMPDLTPPGLYTVKVMVFRNKRPVDSKLSTLVVSKVGIERFIYRFAHNHRFIYAIFGVLFAISAGFVGSRLFTRFTNT